MEQLQQWIDDNEIKVILLYGDGRNFSAGADLDTLRQNRSEQQLSQDLAHGRKIIEIIEFSPKPVIAIIDGVCMGAGLEIALASHIRVCSDRALFGFPEINHSLIPGLGGIKRLNKTVGESWTVQMTLTGELITPKEAERINLVSHVFPKERLWDSAMGLVNKISSKNSQALIYAQRSIKNLKNLPLKDALDEECRLFAELVAGEFEKVGETV